MTHRRPFQPLPFCDSVILYWSGTQGSSAWIPCVRLKVFNLHIWALKDWILHFYRQKWPTIDRDILFYEM